MPGKASERRGGLVRQLAGLLLVLLLGTSGCAVRQHSLEESIVASARAHPHHDARWDEIIRDLARRYVGDARDGGLDPDKGRLAKRAVESGCRDPFVRYVWLEARYVPGGVRSDLLAPEMKAVAEELYATGYPQFVRAMAASFAAECVNSLPEQAPIEERRALSDILWKSGFGGINNPVVTEWEARALADVLDEYWLHGAPADRDPTYAYIDEALARRFGEKASWHYIRGARAVRLAWQVAEPRSGTPEAWMEYTRGMANARKELEAAWQLDPSDPNIAYYMIGVCTALNGSRLEMESWFKRALATRRDCSQVCEAKLDYLADKQVGTMDDRIAFGKECLAHPEYGWKASLRLWYLHWQYQTHNQMPAEYLTSQAVWDDIKLSMDAYLARYPEAQAIRLNYAYHAWQARDWSIVEEQLAHLDISLLNLSPLGGRTAYEQMVDELKASKSRPKARVERGGL